MDSRMGAYWYSKDGHDIGEKEGDEGKGGIPNGAQQAWRKYEISEGNDETGLRSTASIPHVPFYWRKLISLSLDLY